VAFFYPWFPGDFARDTADLSPMEDLFYRRLLDSYYSTGTLTADYYRLYRICQATSLKDRASVKVVADRFFTKNLDGSLSQKRVVKELANIKQRSDVARDKAKKRWHPE
jgi:uncharacterized protein YdaU (DUF1376 family)